MSKLYSLDKKIVASLPVYVSVRQQAYRPAQYKSSGRFSFISYGVCRFLKLIICPIIVSFITQNQRSKKFDMHGD
jgi:hypothetical protein